MANDLPIEEWRLLKDWPDYELSNLGRVRRANPAYSPNPKTGKPMMIFPAGRLLRPAGNLKGYLHVELMKDGRHKTVYIASLMCHTFNGQRPTPEHEACHNDGNPGNNVADNLRWDTCKGNSADRVGHGTHARGERSPNAILTNDEVVVMKRRFAAGATCKEVSDHFGITYRHAWDIRRGKRWQHIN